LGLSLTVSRLGSTMNNLITPRVYNATESLGLPFLIGTITCSVSALCGIILAWMDYVSDQREKSHRLLETNLELEAQKEDDKAHWKDIKQLSYTYWIMVISCMTIYSGYFGFTGVSNQFMQDRFGYTSESAGDVMTVFYACSAVITPLVGYTVDRVGKRGKFIIFSGMLLVGGHFFFAYSPDCDNCYYPIVGLMILGVSLAIYSATFWGAVLLVVKKNVVGTAIGIIFCFQNAALAAVPEFDGYIQENTMSNEHGYFYVSIFLALLSFDGLICGIIIELWDRWGTRKLDTLSKE